MPLPGITDVAEIRKLLAKLMTDAERTYKFAVVARGVRDGDLVLSKVEKLRRKEVKAAALQDAAEQQKRAGKDRGPPPKLEVIAGECRLLKPGSTTLLLLVAGKVQPKAVACTEFLLKRGPFRIVGFTNVVLEAVEESDEENDGTQRTSSRPSSPGRVKDEAPSPDGPESSPTTTQRDAATKAARKQLADRLRNLAPSLSSSNDSPQLAKARRMVAEAGEFVQQDDFVSAGRLIDEVEKLASKIAAEQTKEQAEQEQAERARDEQERAERDRQERQFHDDWARGRKKLRQAVDAVQGQLAGLADALLASDDPNMIWIAEEGLTQLMSEIRASIASLDRLSNKPPTKVAAFAKPALAVLAKKLNSDQVKALEQNKFGVRVDIRKTLAGVVAELAKALEAAA